MSVSLSSIETKVRALIEDNSQTGIDLFTYENSSVFTLSEDNVISVSTVYVNSSELDSNEWSYDSSYNKVTITSSLSIGDTIEIHYTYYPNYSSSIIQKYIQAALVHISANNYKTFVVQNSNVYPEPSEEETNLIALIAAIIIKPDNKSYRLPDVSVVAPRDVPTNVKIAQTIAHFKQNSHGVFEILG